MAIFRADATPLIPEEVTREIFQGVIASSATLSYARRLPDMQRNQLRLPVLDVLPTAGFINGEQPDDEESQDFGVGFKPETRVQWRNAYINAEEVAVVIPIHENVLDDADYPIWEQVSPLLVQEFGRVIDAAVLFGTGAPATWPDGVAPQAIAAGNSVVFGTGVDAYDDLLGLNGTFSLVEGDGYLVNGTVVEPSAKGWFRGLRDAAGTGQPIFMRAQPDGRNLQTGTLYMLDGTPIYFLNNGAFDTTQALAISGDWNQLVYSIRRDMNFRIFSEGVITDNAGNIIYNLIQHDMVALRAVLRLGWQLPNPVNRLQTTRGGIVNGVDTVGRFPFAVLTP